MGSISRRPVAEAAAPRSTTAEDLGATLSKGSLVVGEVDDGLRAAIGDRAEVSARRRVGADWRWRRWGGSDWRRHGG